MGSTASALSARLYTLILLFFLTAAVCVNAQSEGMQASVENYILPQYREKDHRLDYVIYGAKAENRGALLHLEKVKIDILNTGDKSVHNLKEAKIYFTSKGEKIPDAYDIASTINARRAFFAELLKGNYKANKSHYIDAEKKLLGVRNSFWRNNEKQKHVNAWVHADAAFYDKNARILRSENNVAAHFRTRDIDADGIGFDAYNQKENKKNKNVSAKRRFIHIRSNVRIINYNFKDEPQKDGINFIAAADNMDIDNTIRERVIFTLRKNVNVQNIETGDKSEMEIEIPDPANNKKKKKIKIKIKTLVATQITCDKMVIDSKLSKEKGKDRTKNDDSERLRKIRFFDNVVITRFEIPVDAKYIDFARKQVVTCKYAIYDRLEQKITLDGNPELTSGRDRISGQKLEIYLKEVEGYDKEKKKKTEKLKPVKISMKLPVITFYGDNLPGKAAAPAKEKKQSPYHVESDTMDYDIDKQICILHGNVICEQKKIEQDTKHKVKLESHTRISCNKMVIALEDKPKLPGSKSKDKDSGGKQLKQIECFDDVVITQKVETQERDKKGKIQKSTKNEAAESDYAKFDNKKKVLTLTGRPIITSDDNLLKGQKVEVLFDENKNPAQEEKLQAKHVKVYMPDLTYFGDTQISGKDKKEENKDTEANNKDTEANKPPSYVSAMLMDYDVKKDICTLQYEVRVRQTGFEDYQLKDSKDPKNPETIRRRVETELQCEKLCLHLKDAPKNRKDKDGAKKELKKLECFRDVYITRKSIPLDPKYIHYAEIQSSRSDYAEFDMEAQKLTLAEKPVLYSGLNRLKGERIEILVKPKPGSKDKTVAGKMDFELKNIKVYMPNLHFYGNPLSPTEKNKIRKTPILAESNVLHYDDKTDICTLLGNVRVDGREDGRITCDKMLIYLENAPQTANAKTASQKEQRKQLKKLECFGDVMVTHRAPSTQKDTKDMMTAFGQYAAYDPKKMEMNVRGKARIYRYCSKDMKWTPGGYPRLTGREDRQSGEKFDIFFEPVETGTGQKNPDSPKMKIKKVIIPGMKVKMSGN